jgi:hypothetical protein
LLSILSFCILCIKKIKKKYNNIKRKIIENALKAALCFTKGLYFFMVSLAGMLYHRPAAEGSGGRSCGSADGGSSFGKVPRAQPVGIAGDSFIVNTVRKGGLGRWFPSGISEPGPKDGACIGGLGLGVFLSPGIGRHAR